MKSCKDCKNYFRSEDGKEYCLKARFPGKTTSNGYCEDFKRDLTTLENIILTIVAIGAFVISIRMMLL